MARLIGAVLMVLVLYAILMGSFDYARDLDTHQELATRLGFYGILTLGVGIVIIAGGIDLSIGSLIGLSAAAFMILMKHDFHPLLAVAVIVAGTALIGLFHGLLITKVNLQPFLVTLCGLFIYRGLARLVIRVEKENTIRLATEAEWLRTALITGKFIPGLPNITLLLLILAVILGIVLHASVYGRYWFAIGYNEQAARYAGIATDRYKILSYMICSTLAGGLGGVLYLLKYRSSGPTDAGSLLELYAITGAVLGGCSLRGGEGNVVGMLLGALVLPLLNMICEYSPYIGSEVEYVVIGGALLLATVGNELVRRSTQLRRAA
jgi:ribose transport system permease protein